MAHRLRLQEHELSAWQHREKIDVLCLTETGRLADPKLQDDCTFIVECALDPNQQGCAVMVAKWLSKPELVEASPNSTYIAVSIPLRHHKLNMVSTYTLCSPHTCSALAKCF